MPFCPKCREEYREGFLTCSDCGEALVLQLHGEAPDSDKKNGPEWPISGGVPDRAVPVGALPEGISCALCVFLLRENGIPVDTAPVFSGELSAVIAGGMGAGLEIYVPESRHREAVDIIGMTSVAPVSDEELERQASKLRPGRYRITGRREKP